MTITTTRRPFRAALAGVGIGYTASWIIGLSVWPLNLSVTSTSAQIMAAFGAHRAMATTQFLFTEGLPAIGLAVVSAALGGAVLRTGTARRARFVYAAGAVAAAISLVQTVLGVILTESAVPAGASGRAALLFAAVNRLDGVKMFALTALALGAGALARSGTLPAWLGHTGIALAATIAASGIGYLLLVPALALFAWASLPLLLVWITADALVLARTPGRADRPAR